MLGSPPSFHPGVVSACRRVEGRVPSPPHTSRVRLERWRTLFHAEKQGKDAPELGSSGPRPCKGQIASRYPPWREKHTHTTPPGRYIALQVGRVQGIQVLKKWSVGEKRSSSAP
eukprot:scaffold24_cov341-Pavlova_lutheri.AAC.43